MELERFDLGGRHSVVSLTTRAEALRSPDRRSTIIADENTRGLVPETDQDRLIVVPAGERCKSFAVARDVITSLIDRQFTRSARIIGFGGGAVTDLAAFVGSVFLRGIDVVLVPTSLLAMVDAAIGGKTGINAASFKNMVGTFYSASEVRIVPDLLETLPEDEYKSGLAEVIKAALLGDAELLDRLESGRGEILRRETPLVTEIVRAAIRVKIRHVLDDYMEAGVRAHLNLGHTFAHALESVAGFGTISHGAAVAWGINRALHAGVRTGVTDPEYAARVRTLLKRYGYELDYPDIDTGALIAAMAGDKKRNDAGLRFVLQKNALDTFVGALDETTLVETLELPA